MQFPETVNPQNEVEYLHLLHHYSAFMNQAVAKAILGIGKLSPEILQLEGMSSMANRVLLNNLCDGNGKYLEIGSWKGSTFISALYKNQLCRGTSIDHHQEFTRSQFATTAEFLSQNCQTHLTNGEQYELITADCFKYQFPAPIEYDIYFYDGWHSYDAQYKAIEYYYDNLKPFFFYICDDYSLDRCEKATRDVFAKKNIQVITDYKLFGNQLISECTRSGFWNGFYIAFCVKKDAFPQFFRPEKYAHCFDSN